MTTSPQVKDFLRSRASEVVPRLSAGPLTPNAPYGSTEGNFSYDLGSRLPGMMEGKAFLRPFGRFMTNLGKDDLSSTLTGAGVGAAAGLGAEALNHNPRHPYRRALVGAGLGGGTAFLLSKLMAYRDQQERNLQSPTTKASFYSMPGGPNPTQFVQTRLFGDMSMSPGDKSMLMGLLPNLNLNQSQQLSDMLRSSVGAGAGFLIAKYFMKLGLGGQALLALVGGSAANMLGGGQRNVFGQKMNPGYDSMGRQRLV